MGAVGDRAKVQELCFRPAHKLVIVRRLDERPLEAESGRTIDLRRGFEHTLRVDPRN